jgi:ribosomal protein S18 acetylase RimI-like enzyme
MSNREYVEIRRLHGMEEAQECARLMASSEPWVTIGSSYDDSLEILSDPSREIHVAVHRDVLIGFIILNMNGAFVGYIQTVCVAPEWRGQSVGSAEFKKRLRR